MSIEKLELVSIAGAAPSLNEAIVACLQSRAFHIENAAKLLGSGEDGGASHSEDPYAAPLRALMEFIVSKRKEGGPMKVTFSCEGFLGPYEEKVRDNRFFCRAGVNIASVLIDGRICACPNIDRDRFSQGNIYEDNLYEVWEHRFQPFRCHDWARREGPCKTCREWKDCLGGSMHNWHGPDSPSLLQCHCSRLYVGPERS